MAAMVDCPNPNVLYELVLTVPQMTGFKPSSTILSKPFQLKKQSLCLAGRLCLPNHNGGRDCCTVRQFRSSRKCRGSVSSLIHILTFKLTVAQDVIGYYQVVMYKALGFTGGKAILVAGIYNCVGPIASGWHVNL
jgi:hypothetical protein